MQHTRESGIPLEPSTTPFRCVQGTSSRLSVLREELKLAVKKRGASENEYRTFATEECDLENDVIVAKIEKARSEPQHNVRLHAIHVAHQAVLAKEIDIKVAEKEEENSEDEVSQPRMHAKT